MARSEDELGGEAQAELDILELASEEDDAAFFAIEATEDLEVFVAKAAAPSNHSQLSALSAFQRSADRFPPLTPDQQLDMAMRYRESVQARLELSTSPLRGRKRQALEDKAAQEQPLMEHLCASCWRLAWLIVREQSDSRFGRDRSTELLPDLMAEANIALVAAVREFDPQRTPKFATYAARVVRDHVRAVLSREGYMRLAPSWNRVKRIAAARIPEMVHELGRAPTTAELQEDLLERCMEWAFKKLTPEQQELPAAQRESLCMAKLRKQGMLGAIRDIEEVLQAAQSVTSLDHPVGGTEGSSLGTLLPQPTDGSTFDKVEMDELRHTLMAALATLGEREREIVLLRYGFDGTEGWTYAAIAERYGVTSERIRQIEKSALTKLSSPHSQFASLGSFLGN